MAQFGPLSPELALVDPELAAWARSRLPDIPAARLVLLGSPKAAVSPEHEQHSSAPAAVRRRRSRLILSISAAATAAAAFAAGFLSHDVVAPTGGRGNVGPAPAVQQLGGAATRAPEAGATSTTSPAGTPPRRATAARRPASPQPSQPSQPPQLLWARAPQSDAYRIGLFRSGRRVFTATTRRPQVRIPLHWSYAGKRYTLQAGEYRWVVWPLVRQGNAYTDRPAIVNASIRF